MEEAPMMIYTYDIVVIAASLEECITKLTTWGDDMEGRGLRFSMKKMFMISGLDLLHESGAFPSVVHRKNSIECSQFWLCGIKPKHVAD